MNEEKEYNVITLENGIEYTEIDRINFNNNCYVVLSNLDDPSDFCIRRLVNDNNQEYIVGLENREEFNNVFLLYKKRSIFTSLIVLF
jgi:hypothetical protein